MQERATAPMDEVAPAQMGVVCAKSAFVLEAKMAKVVVPPGPCVPPRTALKSAASAAWSVSEAWMVTVPPGPLMLCVTL